MQLRDALLCIDCDDIFTLEEHTCNPRCPRCGSSVFAPLASWVQTWKAFEKSGDETNMIARFRASDKTAGVKIIRRKPIAA